MTRGALCFTTSLIARPALVAGALALATGSCGETDRSATGPTPAAPAVECDIDLDAIADADLVRRVLDACHTRVQQRMRSVRARLTSAAAAADSDDAWLVQAELPDRARVQHGGNTWLYRDGTTTPIADADTADEVRQRIASLVQLVDLAAFGPLYRATACRREAATGRYRLTQPDGSTAVLQLHERSLRPASLGFGDAQPATFDAYLETGTTAIVRVATLPPLGRIRIVFEDGGLRFAADTFLLPSERVADPTNQRTARMPVPGTVVESRSPTPIVVQEKATRWVLLDDPGSWIERHRTYRPVIAELERQRQRIAGFPLLYTDDDEARLAAPFRRRDDGPAFVPPPDWRIRELPAARALVVYPPSGDVDERIRTGRAQLQRALQNRGLTAAGPITAQPFVHLHEGAPSDARLEDTAVRVAVRIE